MAETLTETLKLERLEVNLFRGTTPQTRMDRIYGGQVIAQSLLAAYETVEGRACHSLHAYFIRPGDPSVPIVFEVDRARDGGSFTTRRVIAVQHGQQIFNLAASFQVEEEGFQHQTPVPEHPHWRGLPDTAALKLLEEKHGVQHVSGAEKVQKPIDLRWVDANLDDSLKPPEGQIWFKARDPIAPGSHMHQVILAYASDMALLPTALRPHPVSWRTPGFMGASLDHAMWFHRPLNFNNWHLYTQDSPAAGGGRGFTRGAVYDEAGVLVASVAQEGLIRMRRPKA